MIKLTKGKDFDHAADYEKGPGKEYFEEALSRDYVSVKEAVDYLHKNKEHVNWKIKTNTMIIGKQFELPIVISEYKLSFRSCFERDKNMHNKLGARNGTFDEFMILKYIEDIK